MPKGKKEIRSVRLSLRASRTGGKVQVKTEILCCRNPDSPVGANRKKTTNLEARECLAFRVEFWASAVFYFEERRSYSVGKEVKVYLRKAMKTERKRKPSCRGEGSGEQVILRFCVPSLHRWTVVTSKSQAGLDILLEPWEPQQFWRIRKKGLRGRCLG